MSARRSTVRRRGYAACAARRHRAGVGAVDATRTVLLIRHGDTHGYFDDVGLTERGEAQARRRARSWPRSSRPEHGW